MTTRERLLEYRQLQKNDPSAASRFLQENCSDARFVSLTKLGDAFVEGFRQHIDTKLRLSEEERATLMANVEIAFLQGWADVATFTAQTAKDSAQRVLAISGV